MMQKITDAYRAENAYQHKLQNGYGERGYKHLDDVVHILHREGCQSALDYGCGQASLSRFAKRVCEVPIANYDPCVEAYSAEPEPADLVICTDVLEHVEPHCLAAVMEHMATLAQKAVYLQIATRPAKRELSDGRNAHILVRDPYFWFDVVRASFDITEFRVSPGHSVAIVAKTLGALYP